MSTTAIVALLAGVTACGSSNEPPENANAANEMTLIDWNHLHPVDTPNKWLLTPPGAAIPRSDGAAPEWFVSCEVLSDHWRSVILSQPRTEIVATSEDGLRTEAIQKSGLFGFVDLISSNAVPLAADRCALAIYSRSTLGYWDLGVNRLRVREWLRLLEARIADTG